MNFTPQQVLEQLREIVGNDRDFVYSAPEGQKARTNAALAAAGAVVTYPSEGTCFYVHDHPGLEPMPGCIAGQWLHRYGGVDLDRLRRQEGVTAALAAHRTLPELSDAARGVLTAAQRAQDDGHTWGEAVDQAEEILLCGQAANYGRVGL
jgi:hypothetical protein